MAGEWTPERTAALIALWSQDLSTSEIGRRLGITKNSVIGKVHRLGLPKRRVTVRPEPEEEPSVVRMDTLKAGMCSWPIGEPGFQFCGAPVIPGKPYCAAHCRVAYVRVSKDRKVAAA